MSRITMPRLAMSRITMPGLALALSLMASAISLLPQATAGVAADVAAVPQQLPMATLEEQLAEKAVLLSLVEAFGQHPVFASIGWVGESEGLGYNDSLPCSLSWAFVNCYRGFVSFIQLDSELYSFPSAQQDARGHYVPPGNASWAKGSSMGGPIEGVIPWSQVSQLPYLNYLSLANNKLSGNGVPENIGEFKYLRHLTLSANNLNGTIPASITNLSGTPGSDGSPPSAGLVYLDLSQNQLSGPLPPALGTMGSLQVLSLFQNQFSGSLPEDIGNSKSLLRINLGANYFNASLPSSWSQMTQLNYLTLQGCGLSGAIPQSYSSLSSLLQLDLSFNHLTGPLPDFTAALPVLQLLDLSSNDFYGPIPTTLWAPSNLSSIYLSNCLSPSTLSMKSAPACSSFFASSSSSSPSTSLPRQQSSSVILLWLLIPFILLAAIALPLSLLCWRRNQLHCNSLPHLFGKNLKHTVTAFSLADLKRSTRNFKHCIGKGGYGTVFKATLKDGTILAVKRSDQVSKQGDVEFIREVELLSRVHHRHLVNLVGFCAEKGERVLVYEYMAMGSLYQHLHGLQADACPLTWDSRTKIAIHIALGVEYLHHGADPPLIHRDIKSANILLSADGYCKVADFGLCKEAPSGVEGTEKLVPTGTAVRGSFGYLDPEYVCTSVLSEKSDVYSYGVVLLELISGHKAIHDWQQLADWSEEYLVSRDKRHLMVDPALQGDFDLDELHALCDIAGSCVQVQAVLRPTIRDVAKSLVETFGHALPSGASVSSGSSEGDHRSSPSLSLSSQGAHADFSHHNYSEVLQWTPANMAGVEKLKKGKVTDVVVTKKQADESV